MEAGFGRTRWYGMGRMPQVQLPIFPAGVPVVHHAAHRQLTATLTAQQAALTILKTQRHATQRHVELKTLPAAGQFAQLRPARKHFVDTIKLIAYRAETAMAHVVREVLARRDDARAFLREVYRTSADLSPDATQKTLTVQLHPIASRAHDTALRHLCAELTATETIFPGTDLRLIYQIAGSP